MQLTFLTRLSQRLRDERGIALPAVMGMMLVMGMLTVGVVQATQTDVPKARSDQDRKQALAAAEAGVNAYIFKLSKNPDIWAQCTNTGGTPFVNQPWNGTGADPRAWRTLPGSTAKYTVELQPKQGQSACNPMDPTGTMISAGQLRIKGTGQMRNSKRSLIAKFRKRSFLDYLYFTDFETSDPAWYTRNVNGAPTNPDITGWATDNCTYWRDGRGSRAYSGVWFDASNNPHAFTDDCSEIQFVGGDQIKGPMHTNDEILICGTPRFGRSIDDAIETTGSGTPSSPTPGWRRNCTGATPNMVGTYAPNAPILTMPPANDALRNDTNPAYLFSGKTTIVLGAANLTVNGTTMAYPSNGLIYVENGSCGAPYKPYDPYNQPVGCANVEVEGTIGQPLTIASQKDIIITGDIIKPNANALLGLIANDFVRVEHDVTRNASGKCDASSNNIAGKVHTNLEIDASMMALNHSIMVDNYFCGPPLGTLTVTGALIQKYRGPVGTGSGSTISTGYIKNYNYDDDLRYRQPPNFLDPVQASWRLISQTEQVPAR